MQFDDHIEIHKDGITYLACGKYNEGNNRYISHLLKDGDKDGIEYAAERMARIIPKDIDGVLVPIPGHIGHAVQTKDLANALSRKSNLPVADILRGNQRESLYLAKKSGRMLSENDIGFFSLRNLPKTQVPILIDNCCDYGFTAKCAINALGRGVVLVFSMSDNINCDYHEYIDQSNPLRIRF